MWFETFKLSMSVVTLCANVAQAVTDWSAAPPILADAHEVGRDLSVWLEARRRSTAPGDAGQPAGS